MGGGGCISVVFRKYFSISSSLSSRFWCLFYQKKRIRKILFVQKYTKSSSSSSNSWIFFFVSTIWLIEEIFSQIPIYGSFSIWSVLVFCSHHQRSSTINNHFHCDHRQVQQFGGFFYFLLTLKISKWDDLYLIVKNLP